MGSSMPPRLRHAALRAAHSFREVLASIDIVNGGDVVFTMFSTAILTAVCPQPGAIPTDLDRSFHRERDLCYLELIFALARNSVWHPHLYCHIDRAIGMIAVCRESDWAHVFYLVGIFLRMTFEEVYVTSLSSITEQQWWDMMRRAWFMVRYSDVIGSAHNVEFLPVLVEGTKKYMHIALKFELERLISDVDDLIRWVESRDLLEHRERVVDAMKELRVVAKDMLAKFSR
ncbi:hypothetical protein CY34DRAFT_19399 [Suillus luteus UH-Slu-Lm8-n1]|uniref:Uncharacterized protein n=1 Tax=Suillus luteus UH-Slu-Lm8-n1 TaxID=930992 RepID=A0A0D0ACL3_9AGAM|nr:hypothetical protein CY34DRAFT_19399 [Suillus luteus UH-Slu-Lm8-n1]